MSISAVPAKHSFLAYLIVGIIFGLLSQAAFAENETGTENSQVIEAFTSKEPQQSEHVTIEDQEKRLIMFSLGVPLLVLLVITVILGVAMGVYGKQVFVAHMVCAGLSVTLALAHAVVGIVWFYPF